MRIPVQEILLLQMRAAKPVYWKNIMVRQQKIILRTWLLIFIQKIMLTSIIIKFKMKR